jgi:hypothetical protein
MATKCIDQMPPPSAIAALHSQSNRAHVAADPPRQVQRSEGSEDGDDAGQGDQPEVILPVQDQVGRRQNGFPLGFSIIAPRL